MPTLDAFLATHDRVYETTDGTFGPHDLRLVYEAVARGHPLRLPWPGSDRRTDRALTMLRKARLIVCDGKPRRWRPAFLTPTPPPPGEE